MPATIRIGVGGWTYPPWRGVFYPDDLPQKRELSYASRTLTSLEINGTYYSTFKPASWRKWRDETPDDFVFSVKASRYCTNRKLLAEAQPAVARFLGQGLTELGSKLGPINWQFLPTKKFDRADFDAFLGFLPHTLDGVALRHAVEVPHPSFADDAFFDLARRHRVAIVCRQVDDPFEPHSHFAGFTYARLRMTRETQAKGLTAKEISACASAVRGWAKRGDVFAFFISAAKARNPAAARALIARIGATVS